MIAGDVEQMFRALPAFGGNPVGVTARQALLSRMEGATPGEHTQPWPQPSGPSFLSIFFPQYSAAPYSGSVSSATGLADGFWSEFAVAVLCQAMYNITSSLRSQLLSGKINDAVTAHNNSLRPHATALYGEVLKLGFPDFTNAFNAISDKAQALATYESHLQSDHYITALAALYHGQGGWPNPDWTLFHHWVKLSVLGASDAAIATIITTVKGKLTQQGVPFPASVEAGAWRSYDVWMNTTDASRRALSWQDISSAASGGILETVCTTFPGARMPSCMKEENSYEFTANGQPGNPYREAPSGSCFTAGTRVLMAGGATRPIEQLVPGDEVATLDGPRRVALVATPFRGERSLYALNGLPFRFTATHPFFHASLGKGEGQPRYASVSGWKLAERVPTFSARGVTALAAGASLAAYRDGAVSPFTVSGLVEEHAGGAHAGERLYDVLLDPEEGKDSHYIAGTEESLFVVSSEIPLLEDVPDAATSFIHLLAGAGEALSEGLSSIPDAAFPAAAERFALSLATTFLSHVMGEVTAESTAPTLRAEAVRTLGDAVPVQHLAGGLLAALSSAPALPPNAMAAAREAGGGYHWRLGSLIEQLLTHLGEDLQTLLALGWRRFPRAGEARTADTWALTLADLKLEGHSPLLCDEVAVDVRFAGESHWVEEAGARPGSRFVRHIDQVLYFDSGRGPSLPPKLEFAFFDKAGGARLPLWAEAHLPEQLHEGWGSFEVLVCDTDGNEAGRFSFDLRLLTPGEVAAEQEARARWSVEGPRALGLAIARKGAELLPEHLATFLAAEKARGSAA